MLILRFLFVLWTRFRLWMVSRAEGRAEAQYAAAAVSVLNEAERKPGNGRTLTTAMEDAERTRRVSRLMDARDRVEIKWQSRKLRAERLDSRRKRLARPGWLLYPAGIVDAVAGVSLGQLFTGWTIADAAAWVSRLV